MPVETSIVIRTLNEAKHLELLLKGIHSQNYRDWEIVLVDSGSTDGTLEIAQRYTANIYHIPSDEFTFGRSLNLGCGKAQGNYLVFASGHVWPITNNWLGNLVKPFQDPHIAMVYGRQRGTSATKISEFRDLQMQYGTVSRVLIDEPKGNNGNSAIRRDLWIDEPFDESLPGLEDVDWANKMERKSYRVHYAADAPVYHVHEETLRRIYNRFSREIIAYKRMFPSYWLTSYDIVKSCCLSILRDLLYAFRCGKRRQVFQIPGFQIAQYIGFYQGLRYQRRLTRQILQQTRVPESYNRVEITGPHKHELNIVNVPQLKPGEILVRVGYVGVSPVDIDMAKSQCNVDTKGATPCPVVPGVEFSGIVVKVGTRTGSTRIGQKIAGTYFSGSRDPATHVNGNPHQHVQGLDGGYGQYCAIPAKLVHNLPADMSLKQGALLSNVAACFEGLERLGATKEGHRACVIGSGAMGNLCAQILSDRGLQVSVVDRQPKWLPLMAKYDVSTLSEMDSLDNYDYLIATESGQDTWARLAENPTPSTKILVLGSAYANDGSAGASANLSESNVIFSNGAVKRSSWEEAVRLVLSGRISLVDHTAVVEPLEDYREVWNGLENGEQFKSLLCVNRDLELL